MIAAARLGLRLGCSSIRGRAGWIAFANAIGMYVVLLSLAIPTSLSQQFAINQNDRRSLMVLLAIAVALPVVVMLATMSRLSARTRDRRLASLRLMGLRPRDTNIVAAVEASSVAMTGAALGAASFIATSGALAALLRKAGWTSGTLTLTTRAWVLATGLVFVCATALTVLPARRSGIRNLGQARVGSRGRPPVWRLLPLLTGCVVGAWLLRTQHANTDDIQHLIWWLGVAVLLSGAGVVIATSWITYALSGLLNAFPGVSAQLARRGMRAEPARATRVLSGLLTSAFIGSAALCVMVAWTTTPTFITGAHTAHHPWISMGLDQQNTPRDLSALQPLIRRTQHVRAVLPAYPLSVTCDSTGGADCGQPLVGTCADLAQIAHVTNCSNDAAAYIRVPAAALLDTQPHPAMVRLHDGNNTKRTSALAVRTLPIVARGGTTADGGFSNLDGSLFIPANSPAFTELALRPMGFLAVMDPGMGSIQQLNTAMTPHDVMFQPSLYNNEYQQLLIYRRVMWAVIAGAILMGVLTLAATTLDHRREQRRPLAALTMLGTPGRIIRRTVRLQFLVPLLAGITLAVGAGTLCGAAYLDLAAVNLTLIPWGQLATLGAGAVILAMLTAYAVSMGAGARLTATTVRRE